MSPTIAGVQIGGDAPCRFVAELSNNHNGDRDRCGRLIDAAKAAGADFIKLQCYTPDELVALRGDGPAPEPWGAQGWTMRTLYEKAATPFEWFPKIKAHCERVGIPWFSSVFGPESLALLESLDCPAYKIASLDNKQASILRAVERTRKPWIISSADYCGPIHDFGCGPYILFCPPGYPQSDFVLTRKFRPEDEEGGPYNGFSYHGTDPLPCVVAATLGAKIIEAHFQLDCAPGCASGYRIGGPYPCDCGEPSELESNVSLTPSQFAAMVRDVRRVEAML